MERKLQPLSPVYCSKPVFSLYFGDGRGDFLLMLGFFFQCCMQLLAAFETAKTVALLYNRNAQVENLPPSSFATKTEMTEYPRPI